MSLPRSLLPTLTLALIGVLPACQKSDDHPPFSAGCEKNCPLIPVISVGSGSSSTPESDAGTGTLEGQVFLLSDASFAHGSLYDMAATVSADGANGSPVRGSWLGVEPFDPFMLDGVARVATNWISVQPEQIGGDALPTYQALQTYQITSANLYLASATALDSVFNATATLRSPNAGQVIVFFQNAATRTPLAGLHVSLTNAQATMYASATGWVLDDGTAVSNPSGLVVFGNVEPTSAGSTQLVTVTRAATRTTAAVAAGQFPVKVVQGAVSIAVLGVQL